MTPLGYPPEWDWRPGGDLYRQFLAFPPEVLSNSQILEELRYWDRRLSGLGSLGVQSSHFATVLRYVERLLVGLTIVSLAFVFAEPAPAIAFALFTIAVEVVRAWLSARVADHNAPIDGRLRLIRWRIRMRHDELARRS